MTTIEPPMPRQTDAVLAKRLHLSAIEQIQDAVDNFTVTLILHAKIKAHADKAEVVLSRHVEEALKHMVQQSRNRWWKEALKIVGSVLIGVFVPGLITAFSANDVLLSTLYIGLGFVGTLMVLLGFLA